MGAPSTGLTAGRWLARLVVVLFMALLAASAARAQENEGDPNTRCQRCHGEKWISERRPEALAAMVRVPKGTQPQLRNEANIPKLYVPQDALQGSAHAKLSCTQCHPGIEGLPHSQKVATLSCGQCHGGAAAELEKGKHSSKTAGGPNCQMCHGDGHTVAKAGGQRTQELAQAMIQRCSACHSGITKVGKMQFNPAQTFHDSIHGQALEKKGLVLAAPLCIDCHGTHAILPASDPASKIAPANVPDTCGRCHESVKTDYLSSVHGEHLAKGDTKAATCTSCHASHGVKEVSDAFLRDVVKECSNCHIALGESYLRSYHGKVTQLGGSGVAVCSSCHAADPQHRHRILPAANPLSTVAPQNLEKTCGQCHKDVNPSFVQYIAHVDYSSPKGHPAVYYTFWGMTILLLSVLCVFIPHTLLWFQRTLLERLMGGHHEYGPEKPRMIKRFSRAHRFTHALIIISFMGLVATGFPLKYSYTDWAHNMSAAFGGIHAMGILHRIFAIITFAYAAVHIGYLIFFFVVRCPKPRLKFIFGPDSLLFSLKDLKDFIAMLKWFFRLGPRPNFDRWTYFEKFDYFGEIWGVFLIGGSGLMLWFPQAFTRVLPGWILNCAMVIHSIEALLAASVIFLVHFFNTHLRPEKFPIDMVMWSGHMTEDEMKEERPAEYARLVESGQLEARVVPAMPLHWQVVGAVLGIMAFLFGIGLIVLAVRTELFRILG